MKLPSMILGLSLIFSLASGGAALAKDAVDEPLGGQPPAGMKPSMKDYRGTLQDRRTFKASSVTVPLENAMGVTAGWGGLQRQVPKNDGKTAYTLTVPKDVPIGEKGFWSVTVYNKDRFMEPNEYDAYSFNNVTAQKNEDGSVTIHFGGDPKAKNFLPIFPDWVYIVRLYRPDKSILEGKWKFPEPKGAQ